MQDKAFGNMLCCHLLVKIVAVLWLFYASNEHRSVQKFIELSMKRKNKSILAPLMELNDLLQLMYYTRSYIYLYMIVVMLTYACTLNATGNISLGPRSATDRRARDYE